MQTLSSRRDHAVVMSPQPYRSGWTREEMGPQSRGRPCGVLTLESGGRFLDVRVLKEVESRPQLNVLVAGN